MTTMMKMMMVWGMMRTVGLVVAVTIATGMLKDVTREKMDEEEIQTEGDRVFNDVDDNDTGDDNENVGSSQMMQNSSQSGVNKRKRSNPQYMSEGRQLDKTKNVFEGLPSQVSRDEGVSLELDEDIEKENESGNVDLSKNQDIMGKMAKFPKTVGSTEDDWEEFERRSSIEKLQKKSSTGPSSWELGVLKGRGRFYVK